MARVLADLAVCGGTPLFPSPLHVAQLYLPAFERVEFAFRGIFSRRYFTNNGPLVREFEQKLAEHFGVADVVCVTNGTVALTIMAKALCQQGEVIVPAFTFPATVQALSWAGLTPVLCDVDPQTQMLSPALVERHINERTTGILGVHLWGVPCAPAELAELSSGAGVKLLYDACHGMGCVSGGQSVAQFGDAAALSFHATKIVSAAEGGCIVTNDAVYADVMREIRTFYSANSDASVLRMNGRMSEAQAAFGILSLADLPSNIAANRARHTAYSRGLRNIPGIRLFEPPDGNNFQYAVIEVEESEFGMSRDALWEALKAENIFSRRHFFPGLHRVKPYADRPDVRDRSFPNTDRLCGALMQLPLGEPVSLEAIHQICALLADLARLASEMERGKRGPA